MLFGHQNDSKQPVINDVTAPDDPSVNPLAIDPDTGVSLPVAPEDLEHDGTSDGPVLDQPHEEPSAPVQTFSPTDDTTDEVEQPEELTPGTPGLAPEPAPHDDLLQNGTSDDLLSLKQQALQQLSPLVSHLDQSPEEKFRTTMMLIQSSDNQSLIKDAYEAAQAISDDKTRAQALLDIVNEINYFTQQAEN